MSQRSEHGGGETGSYYMRATSDTNSLKKSKKWLKEQTDKEIVFSGYIK